MISSRLSASAALLALFLATPALASQSASDIPGGLSLSGAYLAGRTASKERDNDVASEFFAKALEEDSGNPVLIDRVFALKLSEGDIAGAETYAAEVLKFNSQHRMAHIVLGLREFRASHFEGARKHFSASAYTPIGELTASLLSAWSWAAQKELNPALKALDKLSDNDSFANFKELHAALIADFLGNGIRAEASFKQALTGAPDSLRIVQSYGNFLERQGRAADAQKLYEDFNADGGNPLITRALSDLKAGKKPSPFITSALDGAGEALFSMASAMTDDQSVDIGLLYAQLSLKLIDDKATANTLIGDMYDSTGREERSIAAYDQVPADSPLRANSDIEIASNLQKLERSDEAIARLKGLVAREPSNYSAVVTLGNIFRYNEDYKNAGATYENAMSMLAAPARENWRLFYYAGISFERLKDWPKAEKYFRRALELSPDEPSVLNYLGYSMIEKKINLQEALAMVKKAVDLKPNDGYIVDSLGWAYFQLGDYEQATVHIERAVDLLPSDPIIGEHLGDCYWRVGRKLEAQFQWQHAKDNKPEPEDLKRIEDKLANGLPDEPQVNPAQNGTGGNSG